MNKMIKVLCLVLLVGFFLFVIISCSTTKDFFSRVNFLGPRESNSDFQNLKKFLALVRTHPGNPDSHYLLACYYQERGQHRQAIGEFKKTLLIDPDYVKAYNGMGISFDLLGEFSMAIESYEMALTLNPDLDYVQNNLGYSYLLQGNLHGAIPAFQKAVALNGRENRFHNNLGLAYAEKGEFDLALAQFKKGGDEAKAHYNMAQLYFKKGFYHKAKDHYASALALNPSLTVVRTGLDAANALARIFEPESKKPMTKALVMPDQPVIEKKETEKVATALQTTAKNPESEKTIDGVSLESRIEANAETKPAVRIEVKKEEKPLTQTEIKKGEAEETKQPGHLVAGKAETEERKASDLAAIKSESPTMKRFDDIEVFGEMIVASFHSPKWTDLTFNYIKESIYQVKVQPQDNGKKDDSYRLVEGPFETRGEAVAYRDKIEKGYSFNPIVTQAALKEGAVKSPLLDQKMKIEQLGSLKKAGIEISNGNGVNRMARRVGDYLKGKGLRVVRLTNADNFNHDKTIIYYQNGQKESVDLLSDYLPVNFGQEEVKKLDRPNITIKVLIGKDLVPKNKLFESSNGARKKQS